MSPSFLLFRDVCNLFSSELQMLIKRENGLSYTLSLMSKPTFVAAGNNDFIHMQMTGVLQSIQKPSVNIVRLVYDNVEQLFSSLYGLAVFELNGLQLLQCESVRLKHVASNALCVDCR